MDIKLPISEELLNASQGNDIDLEIIYNLAISYAEKRIVEEKLDNYENKNELLKCSLLATNKLLSSLENYNSMESEHLATIAHFPYLYSLIYLEMISLIKCKGRKNQSLYIGMKEKLEKIKFPF